MNSKNETDALHEAIRGLQRKQSHELVLVKEQLHNVYESLKPINLIKNTLHDMSASAEVKSDIVDNAVSLTAGYISKRVVIGNSQSPVRKIVGRLVQFGITTLISKYSGTVRTTGKRLLQNVFKGKSTGNHEPKQISMGREQAREIMQRQLEMK